jgi:2-dehydro-3-deoxy-D-arabinonate dehydratase
LTEFPQVSIRLHIERNGEEVFFGQVNTSMLQRSLEELVSYLGRSASFPYGVVLLTGTGIIPPESFTLQAGDQITISIDQVGKLINRVMVV